MNPLIDWAIQGRTTSASVHYTPMVLCEKGIIATRGPANDREEALWEPLREAVALPVYTNSDFVVMLEAWVNSGDGPRPSEDPTAREVVMYYLYESGQLTEIWTHQIYRDDHGDVTLGDPERLEEFVATGRTEALADYVAELWNGIAGIPTPLEQALVVSLASGGHVVMWRDPTKDGDGNEEEQT